MPALFQIEVNPTTSKLVQQLLFNKGYSWRNNNEQVIQFTNSKYLYPWHDKAICHSNQGNNEYIKLNIDEFIKWSNTDELPCLSIKINQDYTALITKDKIMVGCQTIPKEMALKLANEVIRIMK